MRRRMMIKKISLASLIYYYKFENNTKEEQTGVVNSASVSYGEGKQGRAIYFGGYNPLKAPGTSQGTYNNFTINVWIYPESSTGTRGIFISRPSNESEQYSLIMDNNELVVYLYERRYSIGTINTNTWSMITLVVTGQTIKIIRNNTLLLESNNAIPFKIQPVCYVGADVLPVNTSIKNRGFKGYVDELSVWGRVLSAKEIETLYNKGNGLKIK